MSKVLKNNILDKINWLSIKIFSSFVYATCKYLIKKDKNIYLLGCKLLPSNKEHFINNTKYLFLYLQQFKNIKSIWLCDNKQMLRQFEEKGFKNVIPRKSIKGIWYLLKAKYWFNDSGANQVSKINCNINNAINISFWHGSGGLKKVGYDAKDSQINFDKNSFQDIIYNLFKSKNDFWIVNSEYESNCRKSAFFAQDNEIKILGSPRLDILYKDIPNAEIFMEEDFNRIKSLKEQGKKLIIYMPTFRDTGKNISGWLKSETLRDFLRETNSVLICKLHPYDNNSLQFEFGNEFYKMSNTSDVYPILKYTDALITDYSSVYFDYLHLNKPIIYYIPDIEEYTEQCRGFYRDYESLTAGVYAKTESELLSAISDVVNGFDNHKNERKALLDEMFIYQDGNNCERVVNWLRSLNNDQNS